MKRLRPRKSGTNARALGENPRAKGTNPRALGTNPRDRVEYTDHLPSCAVSVALHDLPLIRPVTGTTEHEEYMAAWFAAAYGGCTCDRQPT